MRRFISDDLLKNLDNYQYNVVDKSILSKHVFKPYFNYLAKRSPKFCGPNYMAFAGLCGILLSFVLQLPKPTEGAEKNPFMVSSISLFFYQSFLGLTWKHGRRTGMTSPLMELFIHGCEALKTTMTAIMTCYALNLRHSWWTVAYLITSLASFYLTSWEELHTHQLYYGIFSSPVESFLITMAVYNVSAILGAQVWDTNIWEVLHVDRVPAMKPLAELLPSLSLNVVFVVFAALALACKFITSVANVVRSARGTQASFDVLQRSLLPFAVSSLLHVAWLVPSTPTSPSIVHSELFVPFLCAWGFSFAQIAGRMKLARLFQQPSFEWFWLYDYILYAGVVDMHVVHRIVPSLFSGPVLLSTQVRLGSVIWVYLVCAGWTYLSVAWRVINDIVEYTGIACFFVMKKGEDGVWRGILDPKNVWIPLEVPCNRYIAKEALKNLDNYNYQTVEKSAPSKHILNPFWNRIVKLFPKSVALNAVAFTGLCLVFANFVAMLYYDPYYLTAKEGAEGVPQWVFFTWAAGLLAYQSLGAIYGKRARRTGTAGPLDEMFDHGCDALSTTLSTILTCYALNLGRSWWTVAALIISMANFYLSTWEKFHTRKLNLGVFSGSVWGAMVSIYVNSGLYGAQIWDASVWRVLQVAQIDRVVPALEKYLSPLRVNEAFVVIGALGLVFNIITRCSNVVCYALASRASPFVPLARLLPFIISTVIHLLWLIYPTPKASSIVHSALLVPFLAAWGLSFARLVGSMILAHVTQQASFEMGNPSNGYLVLGYLTFLLWLYASEGEPDFPFSMTKETWIAIAVWWYFFVCFNEYEAFVGGVIKEITEYLNIKCFSVNSGVEKEATLPVTMEKMPEKM